MVYVHLQCSKKRGPVLQYCRASARIARAPYALRAGASVAVSGNISFTFWIRWPSPPGRPRVQRCRAFAASFLVSFAELSTVFGLFGLCDFGLLLGTWNSERIVCSLRFSGRRPAVRKRSLHARAGRGPLVQPRPRRELTLSPPSEPMRAERLFLAPRGLSAPTRLRPR